MESNRLSKLNEWLQLVAAFAVLVGLLLVYQELKQNNNIATGERISEVFRDWSDISRFKFENDTLVLMQKAVEQPDDLADAEIGRLDAFYELIWQARMHELAVSRLGLGEFDMSIVAPDLAWYLNSRLGRAWIDRNKPWLMEEPLLMEAVLAELESMPVPMQFQYLIDLRSIN